MSECMTMCVYYENCLSMGVCKCGKMGEYVCCYVCGNACVYECVWVLLVN